MSERVQWINHQGKEILYIDFSGISEEEQIRYLDQEVKLQYQKYPAGTFLVLGNYSDAYVTPKVVSKIMDLAKQHPSKAFAAVGIEGIKKVIAQMVKKDMFLAPTVEAAKDWLAKQ